VVDAWPGTLPQELQVNGFSESIADGLIETQPDIGPPMTRRRTSAAVRPISGQMIVTKAQLATLRTFVNTTLAGGSLPFTFPAITEAGTWLVKFPKGGLPKWTALSGADLYTLQLSLLILP
jgi:hypothetical protein